MSTSSEDQHETKKNYFTTAIASKYANKIFNSPLYTKWISSLIYDLLELQPGHVVVDMGCGPGLESIEILEKMNNGIQVIGKYCHFPELLISITEPLFSCNFAGFFIFIANSRSGSVTKYAGRIQRSIRFESERRNRLHGCCYVQSVNPISIV